MITLTDSASVKAKEFIAKSNQNEPFESYRLRVGIKGGGCSGFEYVLSIDKIVNQKTDVVIKQGGIELVVDKKSILYLNGCTIDYVENMMGAGFRFSNPNAKGTCGCGQSFDV